MFGENAKNIFVILRHAEIHIGQHVVADIDDSLNGDLQLPFGGAGKIEVFDKRPLIGERVSLQVCDALPDLRDSR